jgi:large subunit ribosomal protein L19
MDPRIAEIERGYIQEALPDFAPGDTVRVQVRVREGQKERLQPFAGVCIGRRGAGVNATFTLRRVSGNVGVERIFPLHSPWISDIEVVRRGDVRRAKLYYLRERVGKRARVRERKWWLDNNDAIVEPQAAPESAPEQAGDQVDEIDDAGGGAVVEDDTENAAEALTE